MVVRVYGSFLRFRRMDRVKIEGGRGLGIEFLSLS